MQNPLSIPGGWNKDTPKDTPAEEQPDPIDTQSVPRSAGIVTETGDGIDIVDETGKSIGKLAETQDPKELLGNTVTSTGDVVSSTGEVVGKAVMGESEYTTESQPKKSSGVSLSGLKSAYSTVDRTFKPITSRIGLGSKSGDSENKSPSEETEKLVSKDSEINLQDRDPDEESETKEELTNIPPDPQEIDLNQFDTVKPDDSISRVATSKATSEGQKPTPPTDTEVLVDNDPKEEKIEAETEKSEIQPEDAKSELTEAPKSALESKAPETEKPESEVQQSEKSLAPESEVQDQVPKSEVDSKAPESQVPPSEAPLSEAPPTEVPDTEVPKSEVPKSEVPPSQAPPTETPKSEVPPSQAPPTEAPQSEVPPSQAPPTEAPATEAPGTDAGTDVGTKAGTEVGIEAGTDAPGTEAPESEAPLSEVPPSQAPLSEAPPSEAPGTDVAKSEIPTDAPGSEAPKSETGLTEAPGTEVPETEAPKDEVEDEVKLDYSALKGCTVNKGGNLVNDNGAIVGRVVEGDIKLLVGKRADENGCLWDDSGKTIGKGEPLPDSEREDLKDFAPFENFPGAVIDAEGRVLFEGKQVGQVVEGDPKRLKGSKVDEDGDILDRRGNVIGKAEAWDEPEIEAEEKIDCSMLNNCRVNKVGNLVNDQGNLVGRVVEGELKHLIGKRSDGNGDIWDDSGKIIGRGEPVPDSEREDLKEFAPFENFPGALVEADGRVVFEGKQVGVVVEGDPKRLKGSKVDEDGDILDRRGNVIGKAEAWDEPEVEPEEKINCSMLDGCRVNKVGNLVNDKGSIVGRIVEGELKHLVGKRSDGNGDIWDDSGKVVGRAEPVPDSEREDLKSFAPFENFPGAIVEADGRVLFEGKQIGIVVEGDPKRLKGSKVDEDGDILDRRGNAVGKAEPWDEPEAEPEAKIDYSILGGKRVNKAGNVVDSSGVIYGRVVEGHIGSVIGRMCDKDGNIRSESGEVIGRAELVPEGQREGTKDGPFAELVGCSVTKEGKVVTASGDIVGRLTSGDPKVLFGRAVDEDGDILDRNGNVIGKAERWEEPEVEKKQDPLAGRRVNREGNVVDEDGNLIGKLTSGDLLICSGKEVDSDGDVVNQKGQTIGHVTRLEDIPPEPEAEPEPEPEPEPEVEVETETEEEKKAREQAETDRKLAGQLAYCVEQTLDRIRPICKLITDKIERAERTPKEELDEEELVKQVKPLIEEGGRILTETNGAIRSLDPDGRIQRNAKHKSATRDGSPEESHLAEVLKELTGTVSQCIDSAKRKIEDMPHAKKELNPLWGLLSEPLFQILAAVGLLLSGVLGLVGKLLSGLGLGGLVNSLLGGLGVDKILESLGLGSVIGSLTGKKKK